MSERSYRRLTRWAAFAAGTLPSVLVRVLGPDTMAATALCVFVALLLLFLAVGPYQAEVALNPTLDEAARRWWRIVLFLFPWSIAIYWHRYVRR
jgi:hypothetical protein